MKKRRLIAKKYWLPAIIVGVLAVTIFYPRHPDQDPLVLDDVSRLNQTRVSEILRPRTEEELQQAIRRAKQLGLKVSISGKRHSQGGHAFYHNAMHLDMTAFNKVIALNESEKTIRVQSGVTWKQIQEFVNPYGLAVAVMQSSNIFTVGGSLSANVHGRDPRYGPVIETVRSFRLLNADGQVINVSRTENAELFSLAIGGFGLFGVILDAELELTENSVYRKQTVSLDYQEYPTYFENQVKGRREVGIHFGRLSIDSESLLRDGYAVTFTETGERPEDVFRLAKESHVSRDKFFFGLSRKGDWGKGIRWRSQQNWVDVPGEVEIVARNNVMRPPIQFLDYDSVDDTDILQEYFVPVANFVSFIDSLRQIVEEEKVNLLSVTLRFVPSNEEAFLTYARTDCFAVVLYINQERSADGINEASRWTRRMVDAVHQCDGTFYLVYQLYPIATQLRAVYPRFDQFLERKRFYDQDALFMNRFYDHYAGSFMHVPLPQVNQ
jgi:hypothetical protein